MGAFAIGLTLLDGCRAVFPESPPVPSRARIGFLAATANDPASPLWRALRDRGWVFGENLAVDYRQGVVPTFPVLAAELTRLGVALILAQGEGPAIAAKNATDRIPIVMLFVPDAVGSGLVSNLARPGGNVTGLSMLAAEVGAKQLELLHDIVPGLSRVAILWHPDIPDGARVFSGIHQAALVLGVELLSAEAGSPVQVQPALAAISPRDPQALIVTNLAAYFMPPAPSVIREFADQHKIPAVYSSRGAVAAGGFMYYGPQPVPVYERAAVYVDKILRGAKPADLPVEQPTQFDFVVNAKTAQVLGLGIPSEVALQVTEWVQ
jgi:putative ABC transport system substrate-binding protein